MNEPLVSISVNLLLILRLLLAFFWGLSWAAILQFTKRGQFLIEERTWLTVVIGVGIDLTIAYNENWWVTTFVIAASSVGIIARSLWNESKGRNIRLPNKTQWSLMDADTLAIDAGELLSKAMDTGTIPQATIMGVSQAITKVHKIRSKIRDARNGEHHE